MDIKQKTLDQLKEAYTRIFNVNAGMDEIRDSEATKELNERALSGLEDTIWAVQVLATFDQLRQIDNEELADLSDEWENPTVDTHKYYQSVFEAWEVGQETYERYKANGGLCQKCNGRFYIA